MIRSPWGMLSLTVSAFGCWGFWSGPTVPASVRPPRVLSFCPFIEPSRKRYHGKTYKQSPMVQRGRDNRRQGRRCHHRP